VHMNGCCCTHGHVEDLVTPLRVDGAEHREHQHERAYTQHQTKTDRHVSLLSSSVVEPPPITTIASLIDEAEPLSVCFSNQGIDDCVGLPMNSARKAPPTVTSGPMKFTPPLYLQHTQAAQGVRQAQLDAFVPLFSVCPTIDV
jgi:hypothetical protein